jgi:HK97 family phage prohead protease
MSEGFYTRAVAFTLRADGDPGDGLTLEGYAAVFNSPTLINDWDGEYEETVAPGAFRHTIRNNPGVKLQFDHGQHPLHGSLPIGSIESLAEDSRGLFVRARLFDNWLNDPIRDAIAAKAIDGMSFRFQVVKDAWEEPKELGQLRQRTLKEVRLFELGPVVFPAYSDTSVALRSLAARVPGLTLTVTEDRTQQEPALPAEEATSEEPAVEARGSSDEAGSVPDPAPSQSAPLTKAEREQVLRRLQLARLRRKDV